jgi:hypothetical protein
MATGLKSNFNNQQNLHSDKANEDYDHENESGADS